MVKHDRIIDYIIEQADRYDIKNLQFEQDIKFQLSRLTDRYNNIILSKVITDINNILAMQKLIISIDKVYKQYVSDCKKILMDSFDTYYRTAYNNTSDLIDLGNELTAKYSQISEQKSNREYDEDTIDYIEKHAFELLTGHSYQKVERIRAELGDLFLKGKANKSNVRDAIEKILNVNRSKAEEIAQTELSRAYNYGVMARLQEYQRLTGQKVRKYWHGFKYSESTCEYCRPRIGNIYDLDDDVEELPAHVRCRCVWLPILDGWDEPVNTKLISRANMLNTGYNKDMIYLRINNRLGINYAEYMSDEAVDDYMSGDRTERVYDNMSKAKDEYIKNTISSWDISKDTSKSHMSSEFNQQLLFWQKYTAGAMADNDKDILSKSYEAIQGIMLLPWSATQLDGWNSLLRVISNFN